MPPETRALTAHKAKNFLQLESFASDTRAGNRPTSPANPNPPRPSRSNDDNPTEGKKRKLGKRIRRDQGRIRTRGRGAKGERKDARDAPPGCPNALCTKLARTNDRSFSPRRLEVGQFLIAQEWERCLPLSSCTEAHALHRNDNCVRGEYPSTKKKGGRRNLNSGRRNPADKCWKPGMRKMLTEGILCLEGREMMENTQVPEIVNTHAKRRKKVDGYTQKKILLKAQHTSLNHTSTYTSRQDTLHTTLITNHHHSSQDALSTSKTHTHTRA